MAAAKKSLYIINDENYSDVREVNGTLKDVEAEIQSMADEHEYKADELPSYVSVYEVTAKLMVEAEESLRVNVRP